MPVEGWYYPNYVTEACPGLPGHKALHECASKFASADLILKDRLVDHAADKESESDKRIKTPGLDFDVINVESEGALIAELKSAALTKQPYIMTFWRPHWVHSTYPGGWIDFPEHKPACTKDPKWGSNSKEVYDCGFANAWSNKFTWAGTKDKWPGAYQLENSQQEAILKAADVDDDQEQAIAKAWVDNNTRVWKPWGEAAM